jgi:hypothetical protein
VLWILQLQCKQDLNYVLSMRLSISKYLSSIVVMSTAVASAEDGLRATRDVCVK